MVKHTSGPWSVDQLDDNGQRVVRGEHIEIATCWHHCVGSIEKEMEANAHLIAAAPDLLDALRDALAYMDRGTWPGYDPVQTAKRAISKAEGRT